MSLSAAVIRELVAAGLSGDALVAACERIEGATATVIDPVARQRAMGAERVARYRQRRSLKESEWTAIRDRIVERDGTVCTYCSTTEGPFVVDHIVPLAQGGTNDDENLCVACRYCNSSKAGKTVEEWRGAR